MSSVLGPSKVKLTRPVGIHYQEKELLCLPDRVLANIFELSVGFGILIGSRIIFFGLL